MALGTSSGGEELSSYADVGSGTSYQYTGLSSNLSISGTYYISVKAVDAAGNESEVATSSSFAAATSWPRNALFPSSFVTPNTKKRTGVTKPPPSLGNTGLWPKTPSPPWKSSSKTRPSTSPTSTTCAKPSPRSRASQPRSSPQVVFQTDGSRHHCQSLKSWAKQGV